MGVGIRQLRDCVMLADAGSFTKAAERLGTTQPALSSRIRHLEDELGVQLFGRGPRGVSLTPQGAVLVDSFRATLNSYDEALAVAAELRAQGRQRLRIGFLAHAAAGLTPKILRSFSTRHPEVVLSLKQCDLSDCFCGLTAGLSDVAFVVGPFREQEDIQYHKLFDDPVVAAVSAEHPLAGRPLIEIGELLTEPFLVGSTPPGKWGRFWLALDYRRDDDVRLAPGYDGHDEWLEAARLGIGVGLCPSTTARYYNRPDLAFVPVTGMGSAFSAVAWHRRRESPAVREFVATAREVAAHLQLDAASS
jgi:DNA-binding transcriptional LysR family regulator